MNRAGFKIKADGVVRDVIDLLAFPGVDITGLARLWPELNALRPDVAEQLAIDIGMSREELTALIHKTVDANGMTNHIHIRLMPSPLNDSNL